MDEGPPKAMRTSEFYVMMSSLLYTALAPLTPMLKRYGIEFDQTVLIELVPWLLGGGLFYGGKLYSAQDALALRHGQTKRQIAWRGLGLNAQASPQ